MEAGCYPGFGKPLDYLPSPEDRFPTLLEDEWHAATLTIRELFMLWFTEQVTNKPNWQTKVFDDIILEKWKAEIAHVDWLKAVGHRHESPCSDAMWEFMVEELQSKARLYDETGIIPVFDASATVIKSDAVISAELNQELRAAVASLENLPDTQKDWHPRSDGKVLDLLHPSLWPLVYGRSRIVTDKPVTLENCLRQCGSGEVLLRQALENTQRSRKYRRGYRDKQKVWSERFQWLPCDVEVSGSAAKIVSYINNLHPTTYSNLYDVIEKIIGKALPLWDLVYRWPKDFGRLRIPCPRVGKQCIVPEICRGKRRYGCDKSSRPLEDGEEKRPKWQDYQRLDSNHPLVEKDSTWFNATHPLVQPEPQPYEKQKSITAEKLRYFNFFPTGEPDRPEELGWPADRIQVIVKLANIHLTPEKPAYDGGTWHVEGQLNEHICATAIYYYDSENVTPSHLAFRTRADREDLMMDLSYEQDDYESIEATLGINARGDTLQELGKVLTRQGRLLVFPNVYQHRVGSFELKDKSKPGHRNILALFLVDPKIPIISTACVPPQQAHWLSGNDGDAPKEWPISLDEAKRTRLELMDERTAAESAADEALRDDQWNFCEH